MKSIKYTRVYCFGRENGRDGEDDFVVGYKASNGKHIEINFMLSNQAMRSYNVDGFNYCTLKEAKAACEE